MNTLQSAIAFLEAFEAENMLNERESVGVKTDAATYFEAACRTNRAALAFREALCTARGIDSGEAGETPKVARPEGQEPGREAARPETTPTLPEAQPSSQVPLSPPAELAAECKRLATRLAEIRWLDCSIGLETSEAGLDKQAELFAAIDRLASLAAPESGILATTQGEAK